MLLLGAVNAAPPKEIILQLAAQLDVKLISDYEREGIRSLQQDWLPKPPALERSEDAVFLRRAYLDAVGRLPTAQEARTFLQDQIKDKRSALVNKLLNSPEWNEVWFQRLAALLRVVDEVNGVSQKPYVDWLHEQARKNTPMDQLVNGLLTASGSVNTNPACGYLLRDAGQLRYTTVEMAGAFLGVDLRCTGCHDHAFDDWTQMQHYQLAACFSATRVTTSLPEQAAESQRKDQTTLFRGARRMASGLHEPSLTKLVPPPLPGEIWPSRHGRLTPGSLFIHDGYAPALQIDANYKYRDARPGDLVKPRVLPFRADRLRLDNQRELDSLRDSGPLRAQMAKWLVSHWRFRARLGIWMAERLLWQQSTDPHSSAEPVELMLAGPSDAGTVMKAGSLEMGCGRGGGVIVEENAFHLARTDALADMVQRCRFDMREVQRVFMHTEAYQRASFSPSPGQAREQPLPVMRRMNAEALWDTLVSLGGGPDEKNGIIWSRDMPQRLPLSHPLRLLGRGGRLFGDDDLYGISFQLCAWMLNSPVVQRAAEGVVRTVQSTDDLFLTLLSRPPTVDERRICGQHLSRHPGDHASLAAALLCTSEFLFLP